MQGSDKNYIRTESRNGSESSFLGNAGFPCCWTEQNLPKESLPRASRKDLVCTTVRKGTSGRETGTSTSVSGSARAPATATDEASPATAICAAAQPSRLQPRLREAELRTASASAPAHLAAVRG